MNRTQKLIGMTVTGTLFLVAVVALIVSPGLRGQDVPIGSNIAAAKAEPPGKDFTITGQVRDVQGNAALLQPGVSRLLRVTVNNTNNQDINVETLTVSVAN